MPSAPSAAAHSARFCGDGTRVVAGDRIRSRYVPSAVWPNAEGKRGAAGFPTVDYDLIVIGGGAGGMAAARTAARMHRSVVLVQDGRVGGDCTFTGCVPSKTLIESAAAGVGFETAIRRVHDTVERIAATETADVLRGEGIDVLESTASFLDHERVRVEGRVISAPKIVVATGTAPVVPPIDGLTGGRYLTNETVWSLTEAPRSLIVLGGGPIGCELAQAFARFGVTVTVIEAADRLLVKEEREASDVIREVFTRGGIDVRLGKKAVEVRHPSAQTVQVVLDDGSEVDAQWLLVAVGRAPVTEALDLDAAGVRRDQRGFIATDEQLSTNVSGLYAVGDITGRLQFTHAADEMGRIAAVNALRRPMRLRFHAQTTPWVTFTHPEVARVGMTEAEAASSGGRVAYLPMSEVDRAIAADQTEGFVKLIAGPRRGLGHLGGGRLVGATVVASRGGEMIHELALAARTGMFVGRLAQTVHAYPTWSTAIRSAAAQFFFETDGRKARPARSD